MTNDPFDRFHRLATWARNRYTKSGVLTLIIRGEPSPYTRIVDAAVDKYILNKKPTAHGRAEQEIRR